MILIRLKMENKKLNYGENYCQDRFEDRARMIEVVNWRPRSFESYKSGLRKWRFRGLFEGRIEDH